MRNTAEIAMGTNIGFVTTDLHPKYNRNRIGNEHRVCNRFFTYERLQKSYTRASSGFKLFNYMHICMVFETLSVSCSIGQPTRPIGQPTRPIGQSTGPIMRISGVFLM